VKTESWARLYVSFHPPVKVSHAMPSDGLARQNAQTAESASIAGWRIADASL
jgi:hypothetical protein